MKPLKFKEYGSSIKVSGNFVSIFKEMFETPKFGIVNRSGKKHIRNYKRPLKNGKGMSLRDVWDWKRYQFFNNAFEVSFFEGERGAS